MNRILRCAGCAGYTMGIACPKCGAKTASAKPAKFSPEDRFASYRRKAKEAELKKQGWL